MALKELKINSKTPENLAKTNEDDNDDKAFVIELEGMDDDEELDEENNDKDEEADGSVQDAAEDEEEEQSENDDESEADNNEEEDVTDDDEEEHVGNRANKRIRTLVEERNRARAEKEEERKQRLASQKQLTEFQKTTVESGKSLLKSHITSIKAQMVKAQEEQNATTIVDLTEQLSKSQQELSALESWKAPEEVEEKTTKNTKVASVEDAPAPARKWISKNTWFQNPVSAKDKERQLEAIAYSETLARQGYSMDEPEMFDLINKRLEKLGLANKASNKVQSKSKDVKSSSESGRKTPKKISQTVQGVSRNPSLSNQQNKSKVIRLSKEQQEIAELYGMSHEEYAFELMKIEEAEKRGSRMVPIFKK